MTVAAMAGVGGGGGDIVIPGDPAELSAAARVYATSASGFRDAAAQLSTSLGDAAAWQGDGADAHASRVQALAAAHQVACAALDLGAQALTT